MTQAPSKNNTYLSDFQEVEKHLKVGDPVWLREIRQFAYSRFAELGFPTARRGNEKWKYTSVAAIARATFQHTLDTGPEGIRDTYVHRLAPWDDNWMNMVFVNGHYRGDLSSPPSQGGGAFVANLSDVIRSDGDLAQKHLGQLATFDDDAFAALNTAFLGDGAYVHIPDGETLPYPLHLLFLTTDSEEPTISHPRTLVVAGARSRLNIIESYASLGRTRSFTNAVTEISVGDQAEVEHYKLLVDSPDAFHVGITRVRQAEASQYTSVSFARGASLARNDLQVVLDEPGSSCILNGLYMTSGTEHVDNFINVDHAQPHTTSRLNYKGILDGKSKAVFGGTVLVRRGAQKADSHQSDKNLILSEEAEVDSKPSLLIYADDVKCGHGATAGNLDEDAIFYMKSRGLDLETATRHLIRGFANDIIKAVRVEPFRAFLDRLFLGALPNFRRGGQS